MRQMLSTVEEGQGKAGFTPRKTTRGEPSQLQFQIKSGSTASPWQLWEGQVGPHIVKVSGGCPLR
jgi:hypothetical protein